MHIANIFRAVLQRSPIEHSLFYVDESFGFAPIPPSSNLIVAEDGTTELTSESGSLLVTEN